LSIEKLIRVTGFGSSILTLETSKEEI
jgi:hypothetical protein